MLHSFTHSLICSFLPHLFVFLFYVLSPCGTHGRKWTIPLQSGNALASRLWSLVGGAVLFPWVQCLARFRCSVNSWWVNKDNRLRGSEGTHCSMGPRQSVRGWAGPETRGISTTRRGLPSAMGTVATDFLHWITELGSSSQRLSEFFTVEPCLESGGISRVAWIIKK